MTRYQYRGRDVGADEALDEDGILRDGFSVTVPLMMRDSMTPLQRSVAEHGMRLHDGHGNRDVVGHRPGYIVSDAANDACDEAYRLYDAAKSAEWRGSPAREYPASAEGSKCTVRGYKYRDHFGAPGTVVNGECVPDELQRDALPARDGNMTLDAIEARHAQRMADEYRRYDARVREMWRNP